MKFVLKTSRAIVTLLLLGLLLAFVGCGSDANSQDVQGEARQQAAREAHREAERRRLRRIVVRERHEEARRLARQRAAREQAREEARAREEAEEEEAETETSECDPNYSGACLDPYASDYDCEGGSGDGPDYTGSVVVVGEDHYGLDADGDGYACE
jgi:hypothetical protein